MRPSGPQGRTEVVEGDEDQRGARILIVDDEKAVRDVLRRMLEPHGFCVEEADSVASARAKLEESSFELVLLDKSMPNEDGLVLLNDLAPQAPRTVVVLVTAASDVESAVAAMRNGAYDYVRKPFTNEVMIWTVEGALRRQCLEIENRDHRERLEELVRERTRDLRRLAHQLAGTQKAIIHVACSVAESRDPETGAHLDRIAHYCRELVLALPDHVKNEHAVDESYADLVAEGAPLHDIGKVGIPDNILLKPGPLTPEEFDTMKRHTVLGRQILETLLARLDDGEPGVLELGAVICVAHHERYDGTGYPMELKAEGIPLCARIAALADFYDATSSPRPYRPEPIPHSEVREMIVSERGRAFDPAVVEAFLAAEEKIVAVRERLRDHVPDASATTEGRAS